MKQREDILDGDGEERRGKWWDRRKALHRHPIFRTLKPTEYQVLAVYEDFVNSQTCLCWPSLKKIAEILGVTDSFVAKAKTGLERKGVLTVISRGGGKFNRSVVEVTVPEGAVTERAAVRNTANERSVREDDEGEGADANTANQRSVSDTEGRSGAESNTADERSVSDADADDNAANQSSVSKSEHCLSSKPNTALNAPQTLLSRRANTANQSSRTTSYRTTTNRERTTTASVDSISPSCSPVAVEGTYTENDLITLLVEGYGATPFDAKTLLADYGEPYAKALLKFFYLKERSGENAMRFCRWATKPIREPEDITWPKKIDLELMPPKGHRYTPPADQDGTRPSSHRESPAKRPLVKEQPADESPRPMVTRLETRSGRSDWQKEHALELFEGGGFREPTPSRREERVTHDPDAGRAERHLDREDYVDRGRI